MNSSKQQKSVVPIMVAVCAGIGLWLAAAVGSGRREPWDDALYWALIYPLSIIISAALGWRYPQQPSRWPLWLFTGQFIGLCLYNGELGNLWPMGLMLFGVISLPAVAVAVWMGRRAANAH